MPKERVLITVKTYPTLSNKYDEVVCTAGLREDGTWVRIYPIPFRKLIDLEQYKKFDIVEVELVRNPSDPRPESHRIRSEIKVIDHINTSNEWYTRRKIVLEKNYIYKDFAKLIEDNKSDKNISLATFKPTEILDMEVVEDSREWDAERLEKINLRAKQHNLFENNDKVFKVVHKLPYKFKYVFSDISGQERKLTINDWELGALFWKEKKRLGNEKKAIESIKRKYLVDLVEKRDIHLFVGTTQSWDSMNAPNPFIIIGVFSPPRILQESLLF
jgi:hypothetical protein